jgi:hypothetical protein
VSQAMKIRVYHLGSKREYSVPSIMTLIVLLEYDLFGAIMVGSIYRCFNARYMPAAMNAGATVRQTILIAKLL